MSDAPFPYTDPPERERQCTATTRLGSRCENRPIVGGLVCRMHGGGTPLARKAAKQRLLAMVEPAFQVLMEAMASQDEAIAVRAAKIVLDRSGFGPTSKVVVQDEREDLSSMSHDELVAKAASLMSELREMAPDRIDSFVEESVSRTVQ